MRFDVWYCEHHGYWTTPSIPHRRDCPGCGLGGWWIRFALDPRQVPYQLVTVNFRDLDQPWVEIEQPWPFSVS